MSGDSRIPDKDEFKIGEVCEIAGVKPFVLRYWETEFPELAPAKGSGGQRTYTKRDVELVLRIKSLLYEERFTVAGAKKRLTEETSTRKPSKGRAKPDGEASDEVRKLRQLLADARQEISEIIESIQ